MNLLGRYRKRQLKVANDVDNEGLKLQHAENEFRQMNTPE